MMKSLRFLDNMDVAGNERPESEDEAGEKDLNVDGVEGEEVEGGWKAAVAQEENDEEGEEDEAPDIEGEDNVEFGFEEEDVGGSYHEEVVATDTVLGVFLKRVKYDRGSVQVEREDDNVEVQDVDDAGGDDTGEEGDIAVIYEEGEEDELASGARVSTRDELDVLDNDDEASENRELEEDDEGDDGVDNDGEEEPDNVMGDEKKEYGTEYLLQPIGQSEEDEDASDFEPGDEEEEEDFEDELDGVPVKKPSETTLNRKRIREETGESDDRSSKH